MVSVALLMPGFVAGLHVDDLALEAAALGPAEIHAQEHLGPVLRLGAAGAGMDGDDGVLAVVLAAEHLLGLAGLDFGAQLVEPAREVFGDRFPACDHSTRTARLSTRRLSDSLMLRRPRGGGAAAAASARRPGPSRSRDRKRAALCLRARRRGGRRQR